MAKPTTATSRRRTPSAIVEGQLARNDPSWLGAWSTVAYNPSELVGKQGLRIFDQMRRDDQVKAAMSFKRDAMLSPGWEIVSPPDKPDGWPVTEFVRRRLDAIEGALSRTLRELLSAMSYGYALGELILERIERGEDAGLVGIRAIRPLRPHDFGFELDEFGRIKPDGIVALATGQRFPRSKFVLWAYQAEFGNPFGESDLEAAYRAWVLLHNSYKWLAQLLERWGVPPTILFYDPTQLSPRQQSDLQGVLANLQAMTSAMVPRTGGKDGMEPWTPQLAGQVSTVFIPAMTELKKDIARALLMPGFLGVTPDSMGSYARAKVTFDMFLLHVSFVQSCLAEEVMRDQIIKPLIDLNFDTGGSYPVFRFLPLTDDVKDGLAETWSKLVGDNIVRPGPEDEAYLRNLMGMPERNEEPDAAAPRLPLQRLADLAPALTVNEVRASMGLPPVEWGDRPMTERPAPEPLRGAQESDSPSENDERSDDDPDGSGKGEGDDAEDDEGKGDDAAVGESAMALRPPMRPEGEPEPEPITPDDIIVTEHPRPPRQDDPGLTDAERRVDFVQVMEALDGLELAATQTVAAALRKAVRAKLDQLTAKPPTLKTVARLRLDLPAAVRTAFVKAMRALFKRGTADCRAEVGKVAKFDAALPVYDPVAALEWLESRADFFVTGLAPKLAEIVRGEILEGLRDGRPFRETASRILDALTPWIGAPDADPKALQPERILTVVRTNATAAYNAGRIVEARRLGKFGLVKGMQYSAILDKNTTDICRHLNRKSFRIDDPALDRYTPPNHYRCRSVLLPLTLTQEPTYITPEERAEAERLAPGQFGGSYRDSAKS